MASKKSPAKANKQEHTTHKPIIRRVRRNVDPNAKPKEQKAHYVDSGRFRELIIKSYSTGEMCDELAECILKIANRLSYAPNFINYSYKDEMIGDAIGKMLAAVRNKKYNPEGNAFAYFTRIAFNAFCNRIKREKREKAFILNLQDAAHHDMIEEGYAIAKEFTTQEDGEHGEVD